MNDREKDNRTEELDAIYYRIELNMAALLLSCIKDRRRFRKKRREIEEYIKLGSRMTNHKLKL